MDRVVSEEERIKRAHDVIERRRSMNSEESIESNKGIKKKLIAQTIMCIIIFCGFYYVKNIEDDNIKNIKESVKSTLVYDFDFKKMCSSLCNFMRKDCIDENKSDNDNTEFDIENNQSNMSEETENKKNDVDANPSENIDEMNQENSETMGIGGEFSTDLYVENVDCSDDNQMLNDSKAIKSRITLNKPIESYSITSTFGIRQSSNIVSANHRGIDLGASTGTVIKASSDGVVTEASNNGDFGKHIVIQNDDVEFIYGHCSELLVNSGDVVKAGDTIAKVGSTGKATGPHLHFEVRKSGRAVDPQLLLDF